MTTDKNSIKRARILLLGVLFLVAFGFVQAQQYAYGFLIYLVIGLLGIFYYTSWARVLGVGDLEGIGKNWFRNIFVGIGLGIATIIIGQVVPFVGAIGIPPVQSIVGAVARFLIIVPFAMVFETVFFQDSLMDFFNSTLKLNRFFSIALASVGGSLFHLNAYGGSLTQAGGSFFSAFLMFALFGMLVEYQDDLTGAMFWHGTLNTYIGFIKLNVIFGR